MGPAPDGNFEAPESDSDCSGEMNEVTALGLTPLV